VEEVPKATLQQMVPVPSGQFLYGATEQQVEFYLSFSVMNFPGMVEAIRAQFVLPQERRHLPDYRIDQFEVTNRQFKEFLDTTGYQPESKSHFLEHWKGDSYPDWAADFPVVWVSLNDAQAFCRWRGASVPTEMEWEKAARGPDGRYFPWGNVAPTAETAVHKSDQAEPAGNRPEDVSPHQVYDMGGNVSELTTGLAPEAPVIIRGGSYLGSARDMLIPWRDFAGPGTRLAHVGFRCVLR
jgi:serine/threonine-protein kinase